MDLLNCTVLHKVFGEGTVIAQTDDCITVRFSAKEAKFVYPGAFETFLRCADPALQTAAEAAILAQKAAEQQAAAERQAAILRASETARSSTRSTGSYSRKSTENNLAFKCNFCDGGCSNNCVGYQGVCSDEQIHYNIETKHHSWCSHPESACYQYLNGDITREELDARNLDGGFVCYESRMLTAWIAAAGEDLSESGDTHHGRRIQDAASDSLAILTTRIPETSEDDRIIFAVFITGQAVEGNEIYSGYVAAKGDLKIELTPEEAEQMKFWHYHKNTDGGIRWSQGLYRYLKDTAAARILADIVRIKKGSQQAHARKVLQYYCSLKGIDPTKIPGAEGAI